MFVKIWWGVFLLLLRKENGYWRKTKSSCHWYQWNGPLTWSWVAWMSSLFHAWASLVVQLVKNLPAVQETWVWSLGWEDPLEKEMATHSSTLAWRIPWTEEPGRPQSMESQRVRHNCATMFMFMSTHVRKSLCSQGIWSAIRHIIWPSAGVQPQQDPGVPSGWTASARKGERETRLEGCSKVWPIFIFFTVAFIFSVSTFF